MRCLANINPVLLLKTAKEKRKFQRGDFILVTDELPFVSFLGTLVTDRWRLCEDDVLYEVCARKSRESVLKASFGRCMRGLLALPSAHQSLPVKMGRLMRRRRILWLCIAAWSVFSGLALWWLLRGNAGPSVVIIRDAQPLVHAAGGRFQGFVRADPGVQRVYAWLLLAPYVVLAIFCFPLERGRLRWSLPVNLAVCVGFLAACHLIAVHTRVKVTNVTLVRNDPDRPGSGTNAISVTITKMEPSKLLEPGVLLSTSGEELPRVNLKQPLPQLPPGLKPPRLGGLPNPRSWSTLLDLLAYGAVFGLAHSVHFYRRFREREHRALLLESNLANARLSALRAQLQPHFLFNSLNAIATLLRREPRLAESALFALSDLLRLALSQCEKQEVTLREEVQFVSRYLEIQQTRFGERLRIERKLDSEALDCLVPTLLLQPLVENALRHGLEPSENPGFVLLSAHRLNGNLVLTVEDNGVGLAGVAPELRAPAAAMPQPLSPALPGSAARGSARSTGIGLLNLRARLEALYGITQKLEVSPRPGGGVTVRIEIPWHTQAAVDTAIPVERA